MAITGVGTMTDSFLKNQYKTGNVNEDTKETNQQPYGAGVLDELQQELYERTQTYDKDGKTITPWYESVAAGISEKNAQVSDTRAVIDGSFIENKIETEKKAPYSYLADENGIINYKGVAFVCDDENQTLNLGDTSNPDNVISIPLEKGGCLKVNRDSIGALSKAISMFSPADIKRILTAIAQDAQCAKKVNEIEELENQVAQSTAEPTE